MADQTRPTPTDLERLLAAYGSTYDYPATPDIAAAVEQRIGPNGRSRIAESSAALRLTPPPPREDVPPPNDGTLGLLNVPVAQSSRFRQMLELAAGLLIFAVVAGALALAFRGLVPDSDNDAAGSAFVPDDSYALYISAGTLSQDEHQYLPLDPYTLANRLDLPLADMGNAGGVLSEDGSTRVRIEYAGESSDGENLHAEDVTIIVSDGLTRKELTRFHPPAHVVFPHLSADGSRLAVQHRQGSGDPAPPTWYLLDTSDGSLLGSVTWDRDDLPAQRVLIDRDVTRLYKVSWRTVPYGGPYRPAPEPLVIVSYDLESGQELARAEYDGVPSGGWAIDPEAGEDSDIASYQPGIELSPDGSQIAIVHADAERVTLVNSDDLEVTRTISIDSQTSLLQEFLAWTRFAPSDAVAKGADLSERRDAEFSLDGRYLYIWGITSELDGSRAAYKGIGLQAVDLERGELVAGILDDKRIELVEPAPDGESLYVTWFVRDDRPLPSGSATLVFQRLDAATLDVLAERELVGYRRIMIDPTANVPTIDQAADDVLSPLQVTSAASGHGLDMLPVDPLTLEPLPGYEPISLGHHPTHAFSPDRRTMAVFAWPGQSGEGGKLYLVDLVGWTVTDTGVEIDATTNDLLFVESESERALYWTTFTTLRPREMGRDYKLFRFDLESGTQQAVASFPSSFQPWELRLFRAGTRLAIWGPSVDPGNVVNGPPHVIIVDLEQDEIAADVEVTNVKLYQYHEPNGDSVSTHAYQPGLAWDLDRELLYIAHADEERVTVVDLAEGVIKVQSDIVQPRSFFDRFIDWLAPSAAAKSIPWTTKLAVLSEDGSRLYVASGFSEYESAEEPAEATDLIIIDTPSIQEIGRLDLGVIVGLQAAPNGRDLLVRSYDQVSTTTGHRLTKIDLATGEVLDQLDLPDPQSEGVYRTWTGDELATVGTRGWLTISSRDGDTIHSEEVQIDLETLTITSREADEPGYREYLWP